MLKQPFPRSFGVLLLCALSLVFLGACGLNRSTHGPAIVAEGPLNPDAEKALLSRPVPSSVVSLQPPDGPAFRLIIDSSQPAGKGTAYLGHVEGAAGSSGTLVVIGSAISGSVRIVGRPVYVLATGRNGKPVIQTVDPSKLPPDHPSEYGSRDSVGPAPRPGPIGNVEDTCSTDDPTRVTVMILYTPQARIDAGGTNAIEAAIYAAVAEANQSLVNSDINAQLEFAHLAEISYTSTGTFITDVCRLHDSGDGFMDTVQGLRDTYRADLVALVVPDSTSCGVTYGQLINPAIACTVGSNHDVVRTPANVHEEGAYHIFALGCIQTNFTLPHELAHSGSARHNWACDSSDNLPTHSNHGFFFDDGTAASWRTIMSYPLSSGCGTNGNRVPHFSNPAISFLAHPTGTSVEPQPADNHDVLNTTRAVLANYRCSAATPTNVWMKDTWGDTGAEPDPDPDIMYASPYVWTRTAADAAEPGFTDRYQHEHQQENPVLHQPTWAYVKLHNGGAAGASGNVKLYYADASTSLAWPAGFTLISDVPVTAASFAAGSTKVVEIPWADPPATGHYCLTARWESATDPIPPETTDINANTRNSNNVVWRNLEIVAMAGGDAMTTFIARPLNGRAFALEFVTPGPRPFLPAGELVVTLKATGADLVASPSKGIVEAGPGQYRVQATGGRIDLVLPHKVSAYVTVELRFHRPGELERRAYRVLVNQIEEVKPSTAPTRVGGMAYDLQP